MKIPGVIKLKTWPKYFEAVKRGSKRFEIRRNDRPFVVGQILRLQEFDPETQQYTGNEVSVPITYMTDFEQKEGFVVLGIGDWTRTDQNYNADRKPLASEP